MNQLTHFDENGNAIMVDVSGKAVTHRIAISKGTILVNTEIIEAIVNNKVQKGDTLGVARIAGIMAVKQTPSLIPLCHSLQISNCSIDFEVDKLNNCIHAICTVKTSGQTGVEMESLTGVSVALLTVYDMCKAIDKSMVIKDIHLVQKSGGNSGDYINTARL